MGVLLASALEVEELADGPLVPGQRGQPVDGVGRQQHDGPRQQGLDHLVDGPVRVVDPVQVHRPLIDRESTTCPRQWRSPRPAGGNGAHICTPLPLASGGERYCLATRARGLPARSGWTVAWAKPASVARASDGGGLGLADLEHERAAGGQPTGGVGDDPARRRPGRRGRPAARRSAPSRPPRRAAGRRRPRRAGC